MFLSESGAFPILSQPTGGVWLGRKVQTKLLGEQDKLQRWGWADQGGLMSSVGKGEASL